ncbi:MAG: sugar phosphate isomerase/epimerase [Planctomycetota bacterium]|jgi:sugar phosphate isomerase/epimerase|nr:sugar phosphate isomerase/epimerase [Planctomycetota bacterium]
MTRCVTPHAGGSIRIGYRSPQLSHTCSTADKISLAQELGCACIEPQVNRLELTSVAAAAELGAAARAGGISAETFGCDLPLLGSDEQALAQAIDDMAAIAQALGANYVFTRVLVDELCPQGDLWQRLARNLPAAVARCTAGGVALSLEADGGTFVTSLERMERALDLADGALANFDPCNLYLAGSDPLLAVQRLAPRIRSGHIKDGVYGQHEVPVGSGELDWAGILDAMVEAGIDATMHVEHCKQPDQVRSAIAHLRTVMPALAVC